MLTTRYIGNCQVCEGDQKLHAGGMVHHGYQRPGHGSIVGDCPGVGQVPYELSCDLIKMYKRDVEQQLANLNEYLAKLKAGKISHLRKLKRLGWGRGQSSEWIEYRVGVTEPHHWATAVANTTYETESSIRQREHIIERCTRRIAAWKPMPIRTVEEEQAKADAGKAQRKAVREEAKNLRRAKHAAHKVKQDALLERRKGIREGFEAQLRALASGEAPLTNMAERQSLARRILAELNKKKYYGWLSKWDLQCEGAILVLGLAKQDGTRGDGRPYLRWL